MRRMFDTFLRPFQTKIAASRQRGRPAERNSPLRRLRLETLEDRLVLSGSPVIVTSSADSGPGSLRAAITSAVSGETIEFANSVHSIALTSGDLPISVNLKIQGPGADKLTISGDNANLASACRVFDISGSVTVTIAGLTIANGEAVVTEYLGANGGGGILNEPGATLKLDNCVLANNEAVLSPATPSPTSPDAANASYGDVCGGGLLNQGTAFLNGTTVEDNRALGGGGYSNPLGGSTGGGIDNWDGGTLYVTNCTITDNAAISAADPAGAAYPYFALGGGIANHTGSVTDANGNVIGNDNPSTVTITNSTVSNNESTGGTGVYSQGGGLYSENGTFEVPQNLAVMTISNCTVSGNVAKGGDNGGGGTEFSAADGGGLENGEGILNIDNSTFSDNEAIGGNGSTPSLGSVADGNVVAAPAAGSGQGGGIVTLGGLASVSNCTLKGNEAIGGTSASGPGAIADGGGIANWGSALNEYGTPGVPGILTLTNSTLTGNEAIAGQGAASSAGYTGAVWGFAVGGGVDDSFSGNATITNCTLANNEAVGSNGLTGGTGFGGGVGLGFSYFFNTAGAPVLDNSALTLTNSTLEGNIALGGSGTTGTGGNGMGGGLAINPDSTATVNNSTFRRNVANGSQTYSGQPIGGGGIENGGKLNLTSSVVRGNKAVSTAGNDIFGGGLLNNMGTATIQSSTFDGNEALGGGSYSAVGGSTGGGIANYDGPLTLVDSAITDNQAISAATPAGSPAPYFALGGGLATYGDGLYGTSTVTITSCNIANNEATGGDGDAMNGGGLIQENETYGPNYSLATMTISNSNVSGNIAQAGANGVGTTAPSGEFSDAIGGGILNGNGVLTINNSTLSGNEAIGGNGSTPVAGGYAGPATGAGQGGGIVNVGGQASVSGSKLIGNKAIGGNTTTGPGAIADGGAIANWGVGLSEMGIPEVPGVLTLTNSTLRGNEAIAGQGAKSSAGYSGAVWGFAVGGGIDDSFSGNAIVTNCALIGNEAIGSDGVNGGTAFGGGIGLGFSTFFSTPGSAVVDNSTLWLINSTLEDNIAQGGNGEAKGMGGDGFGGGLAVNPGSSLAPPPPGTPGVTVPPSGTPGVINSVIDFNLALAGSGGSAAHSTLGEGIGGGVYNDGTFTKDILTAIDFNFASYSHDNIFG